MSLNVKLTEQLFLIEILVHKVHLRVCQECDKDCACPNAGSGPNGRPIPLRVRVKFINFPCVEINQKEFSDTEAAKPKDEELKKKLETDPGHFGTGKSFLFPMSPYDLIRGLKHYPLAVTVLMKPSEEDFMNVLGVTQISLGIDEVCDTVRRVNECEQILPISSTVKDAYDLVNLDGEYVGYIVMLVRLSCFGQSIVTQFQLTEERSYLFRNTRPEEPFPCDKCDDRLDYDPNTYDIIPIQPVTCTTDDVRDSPCCEEAREGVYMERRAITWDIPFLREDTRRRQEVFKITKHYEEREPEDQVVFVNGLVECFEQVMSHKRPSTCAGREPLSFPEPEELEMDSLEAKTASLPRIPWDAPTKPFLGPPGSVAPRVPALDAPPGAATLPGRVPSPHGLGRPRGLTRRVGAVHALPAAQFMSRVGALPGYTIRGDRPDWMPVGYVPPNPWAPPPIIPDALPPRVRPQKIGYELPNELGYPLPIRVPSKTADAGEAAGENGKGKKNGKESSNGGAKSAVGGGGGGSGACGPNGSPNVLRLTGGGADVEPDHRWVEESTPQSTRSPSRHSAKKKDPWAPGGPWGPDGPWGASKGKQPNPPIRYDTTGRLSLAFEADFSMRRKNLPPRVVQGTLNNRTSNPPIRYDTTGLLSGYYRAAHRVPLPSDVGEAVTAIKKGRRVTLKELKCLLEKVKQVEQQKATTEFRPSGRFSYEWGSRYPGTHFGHRNCAPPFKRVPKYKGWCWDSRVPIYRAHDFGLNEEASNWRPGAICNSLKRSVRAPRRATRPFGIAPGPRKLSVLHMPLSTDTVDHTPEEPFVPNPTLHIHRYQGDFFVSMHPDEMTGESEPLQFRIINKEKKPITCQDSESELEIELFQPGAFLTQKGKQFCDEKTQCEERYFPKEEKKRTPPAEPEPEAKPAKGKKSKAGKGKKGKGKKKGKK